ncbi:MAG: MinD/ParA family protein [Candidatus Micrarchaeota archaeon]|nr:MinD/ParA family protein [Candidatus Micrarchaeota archaeon]
MKTPYVVAVVSKKGGVGKTSISVNMAAVLASLGSGVLLIDADPGNANIIDFLGMEQPKKGFKDVLFDMLEAKPYIVHYQQGKFDVLPGTDYVGVYAPTTEQVIHLGAQAKYQDYDFIIVDNSPTLSFFAAAGPLFNMQFIVSTPQAPALNASKRLKELYESNARKNSIVLNRVGASPYDLKPDEIKEKYGFDIAAILPEDPIVPQSVAVKLPAFLLDRESKYSKAIYELSRVVYAGRATQ